MLEMTLYGRTSDGVSLMMLRGVIAPLRAAVPPVKMTPGKRSVMANRHDAGSSCPACRQPVFKYG